MRNYPPTDLQWLNRRMLAIIEARDSILPRATNDSINNFVAVKAAGILDPSLHTSQLAAQLLDHPTGVLDEIENTVWHGHHQRCYAFERVGKHALFLASLGSDRGIIGPDQAVAFMSELGKQPELEAVGSTSYLLAAQEARSYDVNEASILVRLSDGFTDYTHIIRYAAAILNSL